MKRVDSPQTTVVIPVWGSYVASGLREAVASIRSQGPPVRIVVVDNASQAALPASLDAEVIRSDRRLTLGEARNLGLALVSTPYVVVWDADDVMLPGTLEFLERGIAADPALAAFATAIVEAPSGRRHRWPRSWIGLLGRTRRLFALLDAVWSLYPTTGATIMRTPLVAAAGGYAPIESGQDWVLGVSLAFRGRIGWSERPGRLYKLHADSVSAREGGARQLVNRARAVRERLRSDPGVPRWVRSATPLIALAQALAIAVHLALPARRRLLAERRCGGDAPPS